jgi:hypothetical protein
MKPIGPTVPGARTCPECMETYWEDAIHTCNVPTRGSRCPNLDEQEGSIEDDECNNRKRYYD